MSTFHDGLQFWQFMIAGSVAGTVEHTAMFPIDTLKTRIQTALPGPTTTGLRPALASILRLEGPAALFRGVSAVGLGAAPAHAVYFSVYEHSKRALPADAPASHALAGASATAASDAVMAPLDAVKQRLQMKGSPYGGALECARRVVAEEGVAALYAAYRTTVIMNAPFTAVHFAAYEAVKSAMSAEEGEGRLVVHATAGAVAGASAAVVTTPLDVVKTQLQCQGVCGCHKFSKNSMGEVIRRVIGKEGYYGLMRGWLPRTLFHAPAAAICWSTYEASKAFFFKLYY